jgi:sugar O-acyltransferase (sialic acid O-acetyltransferase NeuD family)
MTRHKLVILGTRVFAEEVADLVRDCEEFELTAFGENWDRKRAGGSLHGHPIIWVEDLRPFAETHLAVCAIGTTQRSLFVDQARDLGFAFACVEHPNARISPTAVVGRGTIISAGVVIAAHATIGSHVIINRGALIGHHTKIGDFVTVCPGANIAGSVRIGERAYIGIGAIITDNITIGAGTFVGAGSVVTVNVEDQTQVFGNPAKVVRRNISPN